MTRLYIVPSDKVPLGNSSVGQLLITIPTIAKLIETSCYTNIFVSITIKKYSAKNPCVLSASSNIRPYTSVYNIYVYIIFLNSPTFLFAIPFHQGYFNGVFAKQIT